MPNINFAGKLCLAAVTVVLSALVFCNFIQSTDLPSHSVSAMEVSVPGSWGLSFPQEGSQPTGNASSDYLKQYQALYLGSPEEKVIYLTFDAGYENGHTASILDTLKKHQVPAAFFLVGNYIADNSELVCRMAKEGHTLGNHTFHHPDMSKLSSQREFETELEELDELCRKTTGQPIAPYYRPPQGRYSDQNLSMAKAAGYTTIFWSLAYVDWYEDRQPTREEAMKKLIGRIHPGAVVLLHSTSKTNDEILDELLTQWKTMGYHFGTLDELSASCLEG